MSNRIFLLNDFGTLNEEKNFVNFFVIVQPETLML